MAAIKVHALERQDEEDDLPREVRHESLWLRMRRWWRLVVKYHEYLLLALFLLPLFGYFVLLGPVLGALPKNHLPTASLALLPFCDKLLLFGFDLRAFLVAHPHVVLDCMAGFIYIYHFISPVCNCLYFYLTSQSIINYAWTLGILNLATVAFQISFPTAPPWFVDEHPGVLHWDKWNVTGNAAGLTRVDHLLGINIFTKIYGSSTLVFGSFPSLHAAWPFLAFSIDASRTRWLHLFHYTFVSWAALYLNHHYLVDVLGGAYFAGFIGIVVSYWTLPKLEQLWERIKMKQNDAKGEADESTSIADCDAQQQQQDDLEAALMRNEK